MTLRTVVSCLFRISWLAILIFAFFEQNKVNSIIPPEFNRTLKFGGRYVFLTHLNQLVSKVAFLLLALSSFEIVSKNKSSVFWATTSLPLSFIVPILYWGMYSINPDLVRRKETVDVSSEHLFCRRGLYQRKHSPLTNFRAILRQTCFFFGNRPGPENFRSSTWLRAKWPRFQTLVHSKLFVREPL